MPAYNQGKFEPTNPDKYIGKLPIVFRSAWELTLMNVCDQHPNIIQWASESIKIQYQDPLDPVQIRTYIPDFFIVYVDKNGQTMGELVEIKPLSQSLDEAVRSKKDAIALMYNKAKWAAAQEYCHRNGLRFRVMTENQLYRQAGGK